MAYSSLHQHEEDLFSTIQTNNHVDEIIDAHKVLREVQHLKENHQRAEGVNLLVQLFFRFLFNQETWYEFGRIPDDQAPKNYAFEQEPELKPNHKVVIGQLERLRRKFTKASSPPSAYDLDATAELLLNGKREKAKEHLVSILRQDAANEGRGTFSGSQRRINEFR